MYKKASQKHNLKNACKHKIIHVDLFPYEPIK